MINKSKFKILTSIIMLLFFVAIFNNCYAVSEEDWDKIITACDNSNNFQNYISNYDNVLLLFTRYGYQYGSSGLAFVFNGDNINFSSSEIYKNGEYISYNITDKRFCEFVINRSTGLGQVNAYEGGWYTSQSSSFIGSFSTPQEAIIDRSYSYKGSFSVTYDNQSIIEPIRDYDFSFVINDHTFDFTMEDYTFSNGVTLSSDTIKEGHYVVNLSYYSENSFYNSNYKNYWALGYIDYFPYSNTDPKKQFYFSSGYETLKLYNGSNDNEVFYRFYFKGYSNDSSCQDFSNNVVSSGSNNFGRWDKYSPVSNTTFLYSNRDIYWATDTSLYGFNGFTNQRFYIESTDSVTVNNIVTNTFDSEDPETDSTVYALNNNVINTGSSSPFITNGDLYSYSGTAYGDIAPYYAIEEISGANIKGVDSSNYTILDYVKEIPRLISEIPLGIIKAIVHIFVPSGNDLYEIYLDFQQLAQDKLGIFNAPISFIFTFIDQIKDKYTVAFSTYNFTIPGFRWFDMRTREKVTLVQPQTIDLNTYFINDEDWLHFWGSLRYLTSFLIYLNLIIMLFNKYKSIIGGDKVIINNYKPVGDISRNDN